MQPALEFGPDDYMETRNGSKYFPANPEPGIICPVDIAYSLAWQPRYAGHTKRFYSIAEHTILLCDYVLETGGSFEQAYTMLHHDDSEAYLRDLPSPVKKHTPDYKVMERLSEDAAAERFGFQYPFPQWVRDLDARIVKDERKQVMHPSENVWRIDDLDELGVKTWRWFGLMSWYVRKEWLERHVALCRHLGLPDHMPERRKFLFEPSV